MILKKIFMFQNKIIIFEILKKNFKKYEKANSNFQNFCYLKFQNTKKNIKIKLKLTSFSLMEWEFILNLISKLGKFIFLSLTLFFRIVYGILEFQLKIVNFLSVSESKIKN